MADQDPAAAHGTPAPMEVPRFNAPDIQLLVQDLAQSRRDLFEERRNSSNRLIEERERSRWEIERVRMELNAKIEGLKYENTALVRTVVRIQGENDELREQNAILRLKPVAMETVAPLPMSPSPTVPAERPADGKGHDITQMGRGPGLQASVPLLPSQNPLGGRPVAVPPPTSPVPQIIAVPQLPKSV